MTGPYLSYPLWEQFHVKHDVQRSTIHIRCAARSGRLRGYSVPCAGCSAVIEARL